jgi:hypothetical protein
MAKKKEPTKKEKTEFAIWIYNRLIDKEQEMFKKYKIIYLAEKRRRAKKNTKVD